MTAQEIIESTTMDEAAKIAAIGDLVKQQALDFALYLHPAGVYQESYYEMFLLKKAASNP